MTAEDRLLPSDESSRAAGRRGVEAFDVVQSGLF